MSKDLFGSIEKNEFLKSLREGKEADCPCCGRYAKVYKRRIHHGIARSLINLWRVTVPEQYIHFSEFCDAITGCDFTIARHWDLIEPLPSDTEEKRTSGKWRLTPKGREYVKGLADIDKHVLIYDDTLFGFEGEKVFIQDAVSNKFDYSELMGLKPEQMK